MEQLQILSQNLPFLLSTYNVGGLFSAFFFLVMVDLVLKGFGMWRAARMGKTGWFVALLVINSLGIFPLIFLLMTKEEYKRSVPKGDRRAA